ncbi:MAG: 2-oxoglutarate dehydrogenase E1 component [Saprospiraceae bacterium]|nr:2-oxoglutarate dehydrogenase E1 component [Saprospiraceae bacterium]
MKDYSYVFNAHPTFIEELYKKFKEDPVNVEEGWKTFFSGFDFASNGGAQMARKAPETLSEVAKEFSVISIIHGFRNRGHLLSTTNPIKRRKDRKPFLDLADYNLENADLGRTFQAGNEIGLPGATLQQILDRMHHIYTGNVGYEYAHIENREKRMWLRDRIEGRPLGDDFGLSLEKKKRILEKLNGAVVFEKFLNTKYLAQKRFSLEGGETTIAALDAIINYGAADKVEEVIIGMAHRGRLNVLANIMGKTYEQIFNEFEGQAIPNLTFGDGDVKYHLGFSSQVATTSGKKVHLKLVPNPSHLESVNPVVQGFARAKADILYAHEYDHILPILIHGDAAIAGQGIVYETAQMSQLDGYHVGGTLHFVINNQIGFTTDFDDARTSTYCTGVANLIQAPVFHVNGDDPEAVIFASELAIEYRQKFNSDVFIDMVCYRRHGHNEGDNPKFTQPKMYELIENHPNPREIYAAELSGRGDVDKQLAEDMENVFWGDLQKKLDMIKEKPLAYEYQEPEQAWRRLKKRAGVEEFISSPKTGITTKSLKSMVDHLLDTPKGFQPLRGVKRLLEGKNKLWEDGQLDWAMGELLAYSSILVEGKNVRMSGQDVKRGTFSHRHAVFYDAKTFEEYNRLNDIQEEQGVFSIYNSLLSEFGVLGFEYGYSLATPDALVIWEAQFGDFYNGAQVIIDQYITAAESKWQRMSGLVMLLPHGYEGQGPEHSSARMERFLQAAAEFNITVANMTTPANLFHVLRRQLKRPFRKPLIIMSPKSLLRHPLCVSHFKEFTTGQTFQEVYDDEEASKDPDRIKKVLYCSGKIYYDLLEEKLAQKRKDVAIVRLEQLYPFPLTQMEALAAEYKNAKSFWVQEEPSNMGGWQYFWSFYRNQDIELIARKSSASPATGYKKVHAEQQAELIRKAFE